MAASYLSDPNYSYDFVVATTQASINANMMRFLDSVEQPLVEACYVMGKNNTYERIEMSIFLEMTGGVDPFIIPDQTNVDDPRIQALLKIRFVAGFKARPGLPPCDLASLPDIVTLGEDISSVTFRTMCSEFVLVAIQGGLYTPPTWTRTSQDPKSPWIFRSQVNLRLSVMDEVDVQNLPKDVQDKIAEIRNLSGSAFDLQQLLFDLSSANLWDMPHIEGFDESSPAHVLLQAYFLTAYVNEMKKDGDLVLGCSAVVREPSVSTLTLTGFNFNINPYMGADGLPAPQKSKNESNCATLNYLCAANHNPLPPPRRFPWNWVNVSEINQQDGVISINRNSLANYFKVTIAPLVPEFCVRPWVNCDVSHKSGAISYDAKFYNKELPTSTTLPTSGATILTFAYSSKDQDQAGVNGCLGQIEATSSYSLTVAVSGTCVTVTQDQVLHLFLQKLATKNSGNVVKRRVVDTYSIGVDPTGALVLGLADSDSTDDPDKVATDKFQDFWTNFNDIARKFTNNAILSFKSLTDLPLSTLQNYVFPAGRSFVFRDARFSDHQDLITNIGYADPKAPVVKTAPRTFKELKTSYWRR